MWLLLNGKHFDIERPEGVKDFMELPFFQREKKIKESGIKEEDLYQLLIENPQKHKDLIYDPTNK